MPWYAVLRFILRPAEHRLRPAKRIFLSFDCHIMLEGASYDYVIGAVTLVILRCKVLAVILSYHYAVSAFLYVTRH